MNTTGKLLDERKITSLFLSSQDEHKYVEKGIILDCSVDSDANWNIQIGNILVQISISWFLFPYIVYHPRFSALAEENHIDTLQSVVKDNHGFEDIVLMSHHRRTNAKSKVTLSISNVEQGRGFHRSLSY